MKKIGSLQFFEDVDLNLKFTFDDLMEHFKKTEKGIKTEFLDKQNTLKLDVLDKYVKEYINQKVQKQFGDDFSSDVTDDTMNISWDIKVESIKKHHHEAWWNDEESNSLEIPKLKKV